MLIPDHEIRRLAEGGMIDHFEPGQVKEASNGPIISYGTSSYGYDARLAPEAFVFSSFGDRVIDPKSFDQKIMREAKMQHDGSFVIPPHGFLLGKTVEVFKVPRDVLVVCLGKSTYARCGLVVGVTPLEPEWEGNVTLELSNTTDLPAKVYVGEGIAQFLFFRGESPCETSYADRKGKYQGHSKVTPPRV